MNEIVQ